jgi:hypothetical protein
LLEQDDIEDKMLASLNFCMQISVQALKESDPACLKLFLLLGMLPGGVTEEELTELWAATREPTPWHSTILAL